MIKRYAVKPEYELPEAGAVNLSERERRMLDFITGEQLARQDLWRLFISAFETKADDVDEGWRGEYWGKMMRGACLVYRCTSDKELYEVLTSAVLGLLETAEPDGRISGYSRDKECCGWDLWCRKYVLTGMLHFCDICTDEALIDRIISAMVDHVKCLMKKVGDGESKIPVTETSRWWYGVNSCSILEPVLDLYSRTDDEELFAFAAHIIASGGCGGGNLIELALEDKLSPYQYPETKAYETISFFEGVLAYYELTGEQKYFDAVTRFFNRVLRDEITIIGCAGCTHELFDNSAVCQTEQREIIMQETCVTVTWMRFCARLFLLTGDERYAEQVERSAVNALYGSVNLKKQVFFDKGPGKNLLLPFDSYSPLYMSKRGKGVGGLKYYPDGSYYGCCACIGAAGLAVYPLIEALRKKRKEDSFVLEEHRLNGKLAFTYGPYVLARDSEKEPEDITLPVKPLYENSKPIYTLEQPKDDETVRLRLKTETGLVLLTDYASCGQRWAETDKIMTVWMNG